MIEDKHLLTILVVDDDPDDALVVDRLLKKSNYYQISLTHASSVAAAKNKLNSQVFDLCFVDYRLGKNNGLQLIHELQQEFSKPAYILLTGQEDEDLGVAALRSGAEDYLIKGQLTPQLLERSVRYSLERQGTKLHLTELVEAETRHQEAMRSEQEITNIIESFSDAFMVLSTTGEFVYLNSVSCEYLHKPKEELLGKVFWKVYPHVKKGPLYPAIQKSLCSQEPITLDYFSTLNKRWYQANIYPYPDKVAIHFSDVTLRKEAEQRKDEFISIAGHELKTPLTSMKAYLQHLHSQFTRNNVTEHLPHLEKINAQVDRLANLVTGLLDVTKIQQGKLEYQDTTFEISTLVESVVEEIQTASPSHKISIKQLETAKIEADPARVSQVISNFLTNAIKYSPGANRVEVSSSVNSDWVEVRVADFGPGIPKRHQQHLFNRFYRVTNTQNHSQPGLGIGLYLCSQIIDHYGGKYGVESAIGKGSEFYFSLPVKE